MSHFQDSYSKFLRNQMEKLRKNSSSNSGPKSNSTKYKNNNKYLPSRNIFTLHSLHLEDKNRALKDNIKYFTNYKLRKLLTNLKRATSNKERKTHSSSTNKNRESSLSSNKNKGKKFCIPTKKYKNLNDNHIIRHKEINLKKPVNFKGKSNSKCKRCMCGKKEGDKKPSVEKKNMTQITLSKSKNQKISHSKDINSPFVQGTGGWKFRNNLLKTKSNTQYNISFINRDNEAKAMNKSSLNYSHLTSNSYLSNLGQNSLCRVRNVYVKSCYNDKENTSKSKENNSVNRSKSKGKSQNNNITFING